MVIGIVRRVAKISSRWGCRPVNLPPTFGSRERRAACRRACIWALLAGWSLTGAVRTGYAQHSAPTEYQVKAAFLYNFGRFVDWPADVLTSRGNSFSFCVLGKDPFGPVLDQTLSGETVHGMSAVAKRVSTSKEATSCDVLFISPSEEGDLDEILVTLSRASVLTVSEIPEFTRRGGMINFTMQGKKVRFEINLAAAERAGLTMSSQLLKVAATVRGAS